MKNTGFEKGTVILMRRKGKLAVVILLLACLTMTGCGKNVYEELQQEPDLVIYTPLTEDIYRPIIREFEDRSGLWVEVNEELEEDIVEEIRSSRENFQGDVILGISTAMVEDYKTLFPKKRRFSASSFVIIYNTNIVIYNEIPENFSSLTEEKWKGKIGFLNPRISSSYQDITDFVQTEAHQKYYLDMNLFYKNVEDSYADSMEDIAQGVCDGKYSVGVVTKRKAEQLIAEGNDIAYRNLTDKECLVSNMTVTTLNNERRSAADTFLDFSTSKDMQRYLTQYLNYESVQQAGEDNVR